MIKLSMLIVDDEPQILESLSQIFDLDYQVFSATNGKDALDMLQRLPEVAIVISDQRMPGMRGSEFLKHVRHIYPDSMRILLTGYADLEAVLESVNIGEVFRYVRKPWQPETLKSIVSLAAASYILRKQKKARLAQPTTHQPTSATLSALEPHRHIPTTAATLTLPPMPTSDIDADNERRGLQGDPTVVLLNGRRKGDISAERLLFSSFEEEFLAAFPHENPDAVHKAVAEVQQYQSFEEEFFAKLHEQAEAEGLRLEPPALPNEPLAEPSDVFRKVFHGRSGKPKILVVDDEKRVLRSLSELLMDDYDIIACTNAETALDILETNSFIAVVLSDQRMPKTNGVQLLLDAQHIAPLVPKILMTAYSDVEEVMQLINEGQIFRHIQKPWNIERLRDSLKQAVDECRLRVENGLRARYALSSTPAIAPASQKTPELPAKSAAVQAAELESLKKITDLYKKRI